MNTCNKPWFTTVPRLPMTVWAVCAAAFAGSVCYLSASLPARVATHFTGAGHANGWMTRSQHITFTLLFGIGISLFVIGICYCIRFFPASALNVPNSAYWRSPEHYPEACAFLFRHSFWLGASELLWLGLLNASLVQANQVTPPFLAPRTAVVLGMLFLAATAAWAGSMIWYFVKAGKR
jgi:hypothetical protein